MKYIWITLGVVVAIIAFEYLHEELKTIPVAPDSSGITPNTATSDNSALATAEVNAFGPFLAKPTYVPDSPYAWTVFESVNNGGVVPSTAGIPNYST